MTDYQVLARKWRPQTFEAVVGQDAITRTVKNALASGRIAHAYLFAGPRGVGKTTTARLLARALLCSERGPAPEPCGRCVTCIDTQSGKEVADYLIEIDAASNRRIDDVRALRDNVKYGPSRGGYKVYIIDEVHQLTPDAFDALLKTLEEPPPHVVFILATTNPRDLPATILSRVQRFDFRPIAPDALVASLTRILEEEHVRFDAASLPIVARAAEGSLRDALSLLDTAIAYGGGQLEADTVASLLGVTAPAEVRAFAKALVEMDTAAALEAVDRAVRDGEDLQGFVRDVIEVCRRALVLKAAPTAKLADLTHAEGNELRALAERASLDEILYVTRVLLGADSNMRESPHPRVELEIAAVRTTRRPVPEALEEVLRRVDEARAMLGPGAASAPVTSAPLQESLLGEREPAPRSAPERPRPSAPAPQPPRAAAPRAAAPPAPAAQAVSAPPPVTDPTSAWARVIDEVKSRKIMLGSLLDQARQGAIVDGELSIVLTGSRFQRETLNERANRDLILQAVRKYLPGVERINVAEGDGGTGGDIRSHPAVEAAIAEFDGEVVIVRPRQAEGESQ
jgi:DNA polymerase III subunit gamma/tau